MAKQKNQRIYSTNPEVLKGVAEEQRLYIGREYKLDLTNGVITIFALPQQKPKRKDDEKRGRGKKLTDSE